MQYFFQKYANPSQWLNFLTLHYNEHTAVVEAVSLIFSFCSKTERPIVMSLNIIHLHSTVLLIRVSDESCVALEVV